MAEKVGRTSKAVDNKIRDLKRRGLIVSERERNPCTGCVFYRRYSGIDIFGCHYCYYTGTMRPSDKENCTVRETRKSVFNQLVKELQKTKRSDWNG